MSHRIRIVGLADGLLAPENASFEVRGDEHLLCGMERLGRRGIPVGCRGGGCGVCKVQVVAGSYHTRKMSRDCVSSTEETQGYALACRLYPDTDLDIRVVGKMGRAFTKAGPSPSQGGDSVTAGKSPAFDMSWRN
ncbi:2Fe-2S iron-sulfur cluster-binding protein [Nevskia sp.]|uniref:2Fe-2S iron-sulfur cluster-binding protein n=1 Tax=Nevskia sp. TaxID=1929292 RepID=UPI0025D8F25A|nr:2Fe-2S iron-sulfur cluster-binding protein [Nevskia sp.]